MAYGAACALPTLPTATDSKNALRKGIKRVMLLLITGVFYKAVFALEWTYTVDFSLAQMPPGQAKRTESRA